MNDKRSQFSIMNDTVNDKKGHNTVNDSFAHMPDGLLVEHLIKFFVTFGEKRGWRSPSETY